MRRHFVRSLLWIMIGALATGSSALSQERQGNIVEYFGKEKVTEVREGRVIHTFTEGFILGGRRSSRNSGSTPKEPVVASLLLDDEFKVKEGMAPDPSSESIWERATVNDKNEFDDRRLRSGYLYLEYNAEESETVLLDVSGPTKVFVNAIPHEGDHYDYGWTLIPVRLNKGANSFLLTGGRFPRMRARLLIPNAAVQLTTRDKTLPDILKEDATDWLGAIRVVNATEHWFQGKIVCTIDGVQRETDVDSVSPFNTRKVPFTIPSSKSRDREKQSIQVTLHNTTGRLLSSVDLDVRIVSKHTHHNRTLEWD